MRFRRTTSNCFANQWFEIRGRATMRPCSWDVASCSVALNTASYVRSFTHVHRLLTLRRGSALFQSAARAPTRKVSHAMPWAHGVVVSHPLSMREALGSIPSVSTFASSCLRASLGGGPLARTGGAIMSCFAGGIFVVGWGCVGAFCMSPGV